MAMFRLVHVNLVVQAPYEAAEFYKRHLIPEGEIVTLGNSVHLRDSAGSDLAFVQGSSGPRQNGGHHGFLADSPTRIDALRDRLLKENLTLTEDCTEPNFRSIKFLDADGYECEVYWEGDWP